MDEKLNRWNTYLLVPVALVTLVAGLISIYKDTSWFIYAPLFIITLICIVLALTKRKEIHEFEVLWQAMTIDIIDNLGKETVFTNLSKLKALRAGSHNYEYILYCDGDIQNIMTKEGNVSEIKQESGRLVVKTNIEFPVQKGEEIEHTLTAKYINSFTKDKEYWQTTRNAPGTKIKITILTPPDRPIKDCKAYKIVGQTKIILNQQPKRIVSGLKQGIVLDFEQAKFLERYRLEWSW